MTFTLTQLWQMFLAMCGSIATVAGAGVVLYKAIKGMRKPDTERDKMLKRHDEKIKNCSERLDNVEGGMAVLMKSNLAIMNHLIDGNHTEDLKEATAELQGYLISCKTDILRK